MGNRIDWTIEVKKDGNWQNANKIVLEKDLCDNTFVNWDCGGILRDICYSSAEWENTSVACNDSPTVKLLNKEYAYKKTFSEFLYNKIVEKEKKETVIKKHSKFYNELRKEVFHKHFIIESNTFNETEIFSINFSDIVKYRDIAKKRVDVLNDEIAKNEIVENIVRILIEHNVDESIIQEVYDCHDTDNWIQGDYDELEYLVKYVNGIAKEENPENIRIVFWYNY